MSMELNLYLLLALLIALLVIGYLLAKLHRFPLSKTLWQI